MACTEGLTATCAAALGLPNLTHWNWRLRLHYLANNKVKQKRVKEREKKMIFKCDQACENRECGHKLHPVTLGSYLSIGTKYLHSVTCIIKQIKCLLLLEICIAIA